MIEAGSHPVEYRFGDFFLDVRNRQLRRQSETLPLNSKYLDVLILLVSRRGQLVEKQEIFDELWRDTFVTDAALTQCIKDIRRLLEDDVSSPRFIRTVPKHGYMFIEDVVESSSGETAAIAPPLHADSLHRPFKFLDSYGEQDADLFFGRESEVAAISSRILAHRTFVLHGRSGVGKSSLLCAGLVPRLKAAGNAVFVIRSFTDPLQQMASTLYRGLGNDFNLDAESGMDSFLRVMEKKSPGRFVIFLLDQFEEFFLLLKDEQRRAFIDQIGLLARNESFPLRVVFTLREDLLAEMSQFKTVLPEIFHNEYRLKRLTREQAARAITEPVNAMGGQFEDSLLSRLLDDLGDGDGVDPPQLQIVCDTLYDTRERGGRLTLAAYESLGAAAKILAGYLERVLGRFRPSNLQVAKEILKSFLSASGQRLVLRIVDFEARVRTMAREPSATVHNVVEELLGARVVRLRRQDGEAWLELAHEYLVPEISRWLTKEENDLKQAREVMARALENYLAHQLLIDGETLDLLAPWGERLGFTEDEAHLMIRSLMHRARKVPGWLLEMSPKSSSIIVEAAAAPDPEVRMCAVEASRSIRNSENETLLLKMALWDGALPVRKAASLVLADWFERAAQELLMKDVEGKATSSTRCAVSLAFLRENDKRLVRFSRLPVFIAGLIIPALIALRLRRGWPVILRQGVGGTLGGAAAGFIGSFMLGMILAWAQHASFMESAPLTFVLASLGTLVGALGGMGVSFGMAAAAQVAYRHSRWWSIVGGAAGGALIGGGAKLLGIDALRAIFGKSPTGITGATEGVVLGAGVALGAILSVQLIKHPRPWQPILGAAAGAMCAAALLTVVGGNLFSGSLDIVARAFANSQIRMDPLASFFGEVQFGHTSHIILGAAEGLLFGAGMLAGIEFLGRAGNKNPMNMLPHRTDV